MEPEAFTECSAKARGFLGRAAGDEADNRHRRLLRARRKRPRCHSSAEKREELSPSHDEEGISVYMQSFELTDCRGCAILREQRIRLHQ
jgi:hypothetical protein